MTSFRLCHDNTVTYIVSNVNQFPQHIHIQLRSLCLDERAEQLRAITMPRYPVRCSNATVRWSIIVGLVMCIFPEHCGAFIATHATTTTTTPFQVMRIIIRLNTLRSLEKNSYPEDKENIHRQICRYSIRKMSFTDSVDVTATSGSSNDEYAYLTKVRECIQEISDIENIDYMNEWNDSVKIVSTLLNDDDQRIISVEQIESSLAEAWNWKRYVIITSPIARKFIKTTKPSSAMIVSSIQWLQKEGELKLPNETILQGILESPESYLIQPQVNYETALRMAPKPYTNDATKFRDLVLQYPSALQYTYNCIDSGCKSECGNCWVSFQYQMSEQKQSR